MTSEKGKEESGKKAAKERVKVQKLRDFTESEKNIVIMAFFAGVSLLAISFIILSRLQDIELMRAIINFVAFGLLVIPFALVEYSKYRKLRIVDENFPVFVEAVSDGLQSDMSLPDAIKYASKNDYGPLSPYVQQMVSQISWGLPFEKVFFNFSDAIGSPTVSRSVSTIIETHRSGGNIASSLSAVARSVAEIEKLRRERTSKISTQMMQGYVLYFVFLAVMVGIRYFLLPALGGGMMALGAAEERDLAALYGTRFRDLAIIQGVFSGFVIGKLAEGYLSAGLKHAFVLSVIGYIALTLAGILVG